MIPGETDSAPLFDRIIARWEVSRLGVMPCTLSIVTVLPMCLAVRNMPLVIERPLPAMLILLGGWGLLAALDISRAVWILRHPYASTRWMRAVRATLGAETANNVMKLLVERHQHDPEYTIRRADVTNAVQVEHIRQCDAKRRSQGVQLLE